jgi:hypothetical protein
MRLEEAVVYVESADTCPCEPDLMKALIPDPSELELTPDATEASEAVNADLNSTSVFETIRVRELTLTLVMKEILQSRPSSHWGINE